MYLIYVSADCVLESYKCMLEEHTSPNMILALSASMRMQRTLFFSIHIIVYIYI